MTQRRVENTRVHFLTFSPISVKELPGYQNFYLPGHILRPWAQMILTSGNPVGSVAEAWLTRS